MNVSKPEKSNDRKMKKPILIVEDSPTQAETLRHTLEKHGNQAVTAANGFEALKYLEGQEAEMVISDIVMPGMDGYELCTKIKSNPDLSSMPVILVTSLTDPQNIIAGLNCSADNFILKPYDEKYIISQINHIRASQDLKEHEKAESEVKFYFGGELRSITSNRLQILDLLRSTYESAIQKNHELELVRQELSNLNASLEQMVRERTADLTLEIAMRKRTEEELLAAKKRAEESNQLKSSLMANMSHEFRTPMNGILGFSNMLEVALDDPTLVSYVGHIRRSGMRLLGTLNSIMEYSQFESGSIKMKVDTVDIASLLDMMRPQFLNLIEETNLDFDLLLTEKPMVQADRDFLSKAILKLFENALKFTRLGHVQIELDRFNRNGQEYAVIKVADTGIGINADKIDLIFEEFRQGSEGFSRSHEGTGLGLTISNRIVKLMGGWIDVESVVNKGSVFSIFIPVAIPDLKIKGDEPKNEQNTGKLNRRLDLLLVEDNYTNQVLVEVYIGKIHHIDIASDGLRSIELATRKKYDGILMDINLGEGMNGLEAAREIQRLPGYEATPIIAMTGYTQTQEKEKILREGCSHYIPKPFRKEDLIKLLSEIYKLE